MKKVIATISILIAILGCTYRPLPKRITLSKECKMYFRFLQKEFKFDKELGYYYIDLDKNKRFYEDTKQYCKCFIGLKPIEIKKMLGKPTGKEDESGFGYSFYTDIEAKKKHIRPQDPCAIMVANNIPYIRYAKLVQWDSTLRLY